MDVLIADLDEARPAIREKVAGDDQPVPQVRQVGVDPQLPRVPERLDLLRLARGILNLAVLDVTLARGGLPVRPELDPIGRFPLQPSRVASLPRQAIGPEPCPWVLFLIGSALVPGCHAPAGFSMERRYRTPP